jgi:hypothetical protein
MSSCSRCRFMMTRSGRRSWCWEGKRNIILFIRVVCFCFCFFSTKSVSLFLNKRKCLLLTLIHPFLLKVMNEIFHFIFIWAFVSKGSSFCKLNKKEEKIKINKIQSYSRAPWALTNSLQGFSSVFPPLAAFPLTLSLYFLLSLSLCFPSVFFFSTKYQKARRY